MLFLLALITALTPAYGAEPSPVSVSVSDRTALGIVVGEATLAEVMSKFGPSEVIESGGKSVCYVSPAGSVAVFDARVQPGGSEPTVTRASLYRQRSGYRHVEKCAPTIQIAPDSLVSRISFKSTPAQIRKLKGRPTRSAKGNQTYTHRSEEVTPFGKAEVGSRVDIRFVGTRISEIHLSAR
jgi:hypothetical protein